MSGQQENLLEVEGLCKWFPQRQGPVDVVLRRQCQYLKAVDGVSFHVRKGENLGLVGESGCGKSTLARSLIRLYEPSEGKILLGGVDITHLRGESLRRQRPRMQMIFQDPYSSLNPRMSVYDTLAEVLKVHRMVPDSHIRARVKELLEMSGLSMDIADRFPGEFSGGQRQRIGIARSLALEPGFIIADEPVSALDVSIQAQIINLLSRLQRELGLTVLFISHDLRVVRHITHRVMVMYLGSIVEVGNTEAVFDRPYHPYTQVLTQAAPRLDPTDRKREYAIEGEPPSPIHVPAGCKFHPRCPRCQEICRTREPELRELAPGRFCACHHPLQ
jgi:oligopeptide/dipeptide ABC transporter ATP-binding protein